MTSDMTPINQMRPENYFPQSSSAYFYLISSSNHVKMERDINLPCFLDNNVSFTVQMLYNLLLVTLRDYISKHFNSNRALFYNYIT